MNFIRDHVDDSKHTVVNIDMLAHKAHVSINYFDGNKAFNAILPISSGTNVETYANKFC